MDVRVIQGDIAEEAADALVNAAGTSLRMGSGVAGALRRGGGEALNDAAVAQGPIDLGEVAVTDAFDLEAEIVIHAAAMPHYGEGNATAESIADATRNTLSVADAQRCVSLVIPALGCGVAGFDLEEGARIILEEIHRFEPTNLTEVRMIGYTDEEYEAIRDAASSVGK